MKTRALFWIILMVTIIAVFISLPRNIPPIKFEIGNLKINQQIPRPDILGRKLDLKEGLDLAGGTRLVLVANMAKVNPADRDQALQSLKGIIERRVNLYGVSEPLIQTSKSGSDYRVIVELAGITDVNEALALVGKTAELSFREQSLATDSAKVSTESALIFGPFQVPTNLSGKDVKLAKPAFNPQSGEPVVELTFNNAGAQKWAEITKKNIGRPIAIVLDNQILLAPTVINAITDGKTIISGGFTSKDTKNLATLLNSGALPAPVKVAEQRTIGATLGTESVNQSILAGVIGLSLVAVFMIAIYGRMGIYADLALVIYSLIVFSLFKLIPVTLTLAGIAGFILSIGMAVDANILIFERMKEEIRWGRDKASAIEAGFTRAFPSIRDSNISSLITCAILYWFGTGPVRGFALTLAIGIVVSLFTAVTVTRTFLRTFERSHK